MLRPPRALALGLALQALAARPCAADELLVLAAASLAEALQEAERATRAPGAPEARFSFAGSNTLARQVIAGAPADVFVSADLAQVEAVVAAGRARSEERVELFSNALVVVVPAEARQAPATARELLGLRRLALADPEAVPAGVYARRWLESLDLWLRLRERVLPALDVRAALAAVGAGLAPAGIVYRTDARASRRVRVAFEVPASEAPRIVYAGVPLLRSRQPQAAAAFLKHLQEPQAQRVFARHGFVPLAEAR